MRKKIFLIIFWGIIIGIIACVFIINKISNGKTEEALNEYTPEIEISDEELRTTMVTLYFINYETEEISSEVRLMDSKELLLDPYETLINLLIEGPKDSSLSAIIPEGTQVLATSLDGDKLIVNFSREFIDGAPEGSTQIKNMIYTIVNTLTELKEIESVTFLIEGESVIGFESDGIDLTNEFMSNK